MKTKEKIFKTAAYVARNLEDPYYGGVAAELAFFFLLSAVPTTMLIGVFSGFFSVSLSFGMELIKIYAPEEFYSLIIPYLKGPAYSNLGAFFMIFLIWLASKGFYSVIRISNYAYAIPMLGRFNIFERIKAIKITILFIFMIVFGLFIVIFGQLIGEFISANSLAIFQNVIEIDKIWYRLRWPMAFVIFYYILIYIYSSSVNVKMSHKDFRPGAVFATIGILVASVIFTFYVSHFANYDILYGSLASIAVVMLWFYIIGFVIVIGIQINVAYLKFFRATGEEEQIY